MPKVTHSQNRMLRLLRLIFQRGQISRSELAEQTGYSAFLVSRMCDELLREGLLRETGPGTSTGGRPPTLLSVNHELGRLVGVHIGTVNARVAVGDINGELILYRKGPSLVERGPDYAIAHIISMIEEALREARTSTNQLQAIGIGISGVLDRDTGTTLFWPKVPQWVNVPVRQIFSTHFGTLVEIGDSPRTMELAERRLGAAGGVDHFIYVTVGAGVGAALFFNGELYTGSRGFAGEFGHIPVEEDGPLCSCGNRGCVEALVSASALIRKARRAVQEGLTIQLWQLCGGDVERITVEMIAEAADAGDRFAVSLLTEAGMYLGRGLLSLVNLLNPALIVVSGGIAVAAGRFLMPVAEQVVRQRALSRPADHGRICLSTLGESDWARGAAFLVAERALEDLFNSRFKGNSVLEEVS